MVFYKYVAIGDSTTEGLEDLDINGGYRGWANRLAEHLATRARANFENQKHPLATIQYANLAIRGLCAKEVKEQQLPLALTMNADVATVVAGVNDLLRPRFSLSQVAGDVESMIAALRNQGVTVLTFTMPDMTHINPVTRLIRGRLRALNQRLRETCQRTGALLLDLEHQPLAADKRLWHEDRLHANSLGHERIAQGLLDTLFSPQSNEYVWKRPLPPMPPPGILGVVLGEIAWSQNYLFPWVWRHLKGESSSHKRLPKRPQLLPFESL